MNLTSVRERLERRSRRRRNTHRFRQIASVAVRYGLADRLRKMPGKRMQQWLCGSAAQSIADRSTPVRIRLALSELGTTFIKFDQMLSTRPDLVGQDVAAELTHLHSQTPPDLSGAAKATALRTTRQHGWCKNCVGGAKPAKNANADGTLMDFRRHGASMDWSGLRFAVSHVLAIGLVLGGTPSAQAQLRPEPDAIKLAPRELIDRLRDSPTDYFRFVNRPWIARVCEVFAADLPNVPIVRLHGDAHIEQFAVTENAWGLDDFDDSARGPALVDIVRFLGSVDIALRRRDWSGSREAVFDRFFAGYRRGLAEPDYRTPQPAIVGRLRTQAPRSRAAFLEWGETQLQPMGEANVKAVVAGMGALARVVHAERPDLPPGYLTVARAGWLRMGVGGALADKILIRVQGPSAKPDDDELVEAKRVQPLGGVPCLEPPPTIQPALRVIAGVRQVGRLKHNILAAGPELVIPEVEVQGQQLRNWWIRSWDWSYRELRVDDLRSVQELEEIVYDAGVQLGGGALRELAGAEAYSGQQRVRETLARLERRIRDETSRLVEELLLGWKALGVR